MIWTTVAIEMNYLGLLLLPLSVIHCPCLLGESFYQVKPFGMYNILLAATILKVWQQPTFLMF